MPAPIPPPSFREALRFWWRLGWISFGGPAGQIAIMHRELVERRKWLSESHFLHALNFCMLLPGPEAQQLATYLGWRLHGARGGIAAGALFVLPSALILYGLSALYVCGQEQHWLQGIFYGLTPAVIALIAAAVKKIGRKSLKTPLMWGIAIASFAAIFFLQLSFIWILLTAAAIGLLGSRYWPQQFPSSGHGASAQPDTEAAPLPPCPRAGWSRTLKVCGIGVILWTLPMLALGLTLGWHSVPTRQGFFFSQAALITFGGAYAVLPYVAQMTVDHFGWLTQRQMMTGLGLAETTPGPLIMVLQFIGFMAAWNHPGTLSPWLAATAGAAITTWVTFLPSFLFIFLGGPYVDGLRQRPALTHALTAITAAVVGVILNLAISFTRHAIFPTAGGIDWLVLITAIAVWVAMEKYRVNLLLVLFTCAALGALTSWII
jgi:chromate transporter